MGGMRIHKLLMHDSMTIVRSAAEYELAHHTTYLSFGFRYYGVWLITRCGTLRKFGYNLHDWILCIAILILTGIASRTIAFLGMLAFQRK